MPQRCSRIARRRGSPRRSRPSSARKASSGETPLKKVDVIIMGAGIAGGFLARQLKLTRPGLSVLVLEASPKMTDYKVGESTVEVAANYMIRRLNLGTYLYQHQLPKNGLRFFFDSEKKDLPLTKMS